jgi:hypothetical protein
MMFVVVKHFINEAVSPSRFTLNVSSKLSNKTRGGINKP